MEAAEFFSLTNWKLRVSTSGAQTGRNGLLGACSQADPFRTDCIARQRVIRRMRSICRMAPRSGMRMAPHSGMRMALRRQTGSFQPPLSRQTGSRRFLIKKTIFQSSSGFIASSPPSTYGKDKFSILPPSCPFPPSASPLEGTNSQFFSRFVPFRLPLRP